MTESLENCSLHERTDCTLCDECGHESALHASAHDTGAWATVTCWAEFTCSTCAAERQPAEARAY
jgi:hypothetical protein